MEAAKPTAVITKDVKAGTNMGNNPRNKEFKVKVTISNTAKQEK